MRDLPTPLTAYLAGADEPCPCCNYNLRGLTVAACPECNQALTLRVALKEPRLAWFLVAVIALSCGIGVHGFLVGLLIYGWANGYIGGSGVFSTVACVVGSFLTLTCAAAALLVRRRRFARRSRRARTAIALGACALTAASLATLILIPK
jgi:nitrate reductase gamma subunit